MQPSLPSVTANISKRPGYQWALPIEKQNLEEMSAIALHATKTGHTVAFESAQPVITNVRDPYERLLAEQLTIKATEKKNYNRKGASTLSPAWIPLLPRLLT